MVSGNSKFFLQLLILSIYIFSMQFIGVSAAIFLLILPFGNASDVSQGVIQQLPFIAGIAAFTTICMAFNYYSNNKKCYLAFGKALPANPIHTVELSISQDIESVFLSCMKSLDSISGGFKKIESDSNNFKITAVTKWNKKSSSRGETIIFALECYPNLNTHVFITSQSNHLLNLLDLAKNLENLKLITASINENLKNGEIK
jgi:hypothetical protein